MLDELRTFLGLLVYYSQHIPDFARKTESLWSTLKGKYQFPLVGERLEVLNWLKAEPGIAQDLGVSQLGVAF